MRSVPLTTETLKDADCVLIVTNHTAIDWRLDRASTRAWSSTRATR